MRDRAGMRIMNFNYVICSLFCLVGLSVFAQAGSAIEKNLTQTYQPSKTTFHLEGGKTTFLADHFGSNPCYIIIDSVIVQDKEEFYVFHSEQESPLIPSWKTSYIRLVRELTADNFAVEIWTQGFAANAPVVLKECCIQMTPVLEKSE